MPIVVRAWLNPGGAAEFSAWVPEGFDCNELVRGWVRDGASYVTVTSPEGDVQVVFSD